MPRNKLSTDAAIWSPAHCQHLYGNRTLSNNRTKKMLRSTRSRGYLGSGLTDASSSIEMILLLLLLLPYHNASENTEKASELSSHSLFGTLAPSQPSRSHPRHLRARNSALLSTPSPTLPIGGFVFSWGRPGSDRGISDINNQTSGRKMLTFTGAIWLRRFQPTLWEPAPVSHSLIRGQDEPAQQPNQRGRGKTRGARG